MRSGQLFRSVGALTDDALSPKVRNLLWGTASRSMSEDRRECLSVGLEEICEVLQWESVDRFISEQENFAGEA